ncbi:DUF4288 domain-containing protein [Hymenobacter persicinus]|uniref:DUF4288 domain-containing protein n=1 Tax=Hymenobacter persicinus TaxID=2025506 RepID=A0A4Q5L6F2_9BACT|nr:DUF4288 domain-containing protein [Hymenobacter persicinus]RYU74794.1 DUF4288 domain-containing protein [Hymenobacter persicinus]
MSQHHQKPELWYVARIILKCSAPHQVEEHLFDEQIRLIQASNSEEAYQKALILGKQEELEYLNEDGMTVRWSFEGLFDLDIVESLTDGAEITSKRIRADSAQELVVAKHQLTLFWQADNTGKTAEELLGDMKS